MSAKGRILTPSDETEFVDSLIKFVVHHCFPHVVPESIDVVIKALLRMNRRAMQKKGWDVMSERIALTIVVLDFARKCEQLLHQISSKIPFGLLKYRVNFVSPNQDQKEDHQIVLKRVD
jgi:hypothetical protein